MDLITRLAHLSSHYQDDASKAAKAEAYLSACVAQAAALEAVLLATCMVFMPQVRRTSVYARKRFTRKRNKALEFSLFELIKIAEELDWFPRKRIRWGGKRGALVDYAHEVRKLRNFVHPGVWVRTTRDMAVFEAGTFDAVYEVFQVATDWLIYRVNESLRKHIDVEEKREAAATTASNNQTI